MLNVTSSAQQLDEARPRICAALDQAIEESGIRNRELAALIGTHEVNVGRWRRAKEPSRETVAAIEQALDKPLGYVSRLAGYFDEASADELLRLIQTTSLLSDGYRRIIADVLETGIRGTAEERSAQEAWRRTAASKRRSRSN